MDLTGEDLGQEPLALLVGAEVHEGGTHRVDGEHGHRRAGAHRLVEEEELLDGRPALAPVLLGPADAEPTVLAHLPDDPAVGRAHPLATEEVLLDVGRQKPAVVLTQLLAQGLLLGC